MNEDRRRWARIEASLECTVASGDQTFEAKVLNLSRGGLAVAAGAGLLKAGETVSLMLDCSPGLASLGLSGTVVRLVVGPAETVYGVRFEALPPDSQQELLFLLRLLAAGRGSGQRAHPRVSARIAVRCKSRERFEALLNDLSRGGLSIRCPQPVELGATLGVDLGVPDHSELISVEGTVTHIEQLPGGKQLVGLRFTPPTKEQLDRVQQLLDLLIGLEGGG